MRRLLVFPLLFAFQLSAAEPPAWVAESNKNAKVLLEVGARFSPEGAGRTGIEGLDEQILDLKPGVTDRIRKANLEALKELEGRLAKATDPLVKQDLQILVDQTRESLRGLDLNEKHYVPYINVSQIVFFGLQALLDDQIAAARRPSSLVRMRKYTGLEPGYTPLTELAKQRTMERMGKPGLMMPAKAEVERDLKTAQFVIDGIGQMFAKYKIEGYEQPYAKLKEQLTAYNDWVRTEILPKSRNDFKLPKEVYDYRLQTYGIDIPSTQLTDMAHTAFDSIQKQMQELAPRIAKERGWNLTDYRAVIRELKKQELGADNTLPHYQKRITDLEAIIRREKLVSLPDRPARMRLATPAESAQQPAPHMRPPRLVGNTGETGEFVLPTSTPGNKNKLDDFSFEAASWTLSAHEARPGHEMQFSAMVERGVSLPRAIYAFNSTNVEGWGLYSEWMVFPHMPMEGQLISLQHRMMRAARAYLDPELHAGKIDPVAAKKILMEDVVLSEPMATQEVERYTFRAPGQATSYFYGYTRLMELRRDVEKALGAKFNQQRFHDYVLAQGLLPPQLLRKTVMEDFVKAQQQMAAAKPLTTEELRKIFEEKNPRVFYLDVREPKEIEELGSLAGYVNIPLGQIEARLNEIPKDKLIVPL